MCCSCNNNDKKTLKKMLLNKLAELDRTSYEDDEDNDTSDKQLEDELQELVDLLDNAKTTISQIQDMVEEVEDTLDDIKEAIGQAEEDIEHAQDIVEHLR